MVALPGRNRAGSRRVWPSPAPPGGSGYPGRRPCPSLLRTSRSPQGVRAARGRAPTRHQRLRASWGRWAALVGT
jgi:hypothetical protein